MRWVTPLMVMAILLGAANSACDDDDTSVRTGDAGADAASMVQCVAPFGSLTRTRLGAATKPHGRCAAASDLDVICGNDVHQVASRCGHSCLQTGAAEPACSNRCMSERFKQAISLNCSTCYTNAEICLSQTCAAPCATDRADAACIACQTTHGCGKAFFQCSGLPEALPTPLDGGSATDAAG